MSETIHELLRRYLEGETSQHELQLLKDYFSRTSPLPHDLLPYKQMFDLIADRPATPSVQALDRFAASVPASPGRHRWLIWAAAACIAAVAVVLLVPREQEEDLAVAYINGQPTYDRQAAFRMSQEALAEIFSNAGPEQQLNEIFNTP